MDSEFMEDILISILRLTEGEKSVSVVRLVEFIGFPDAMVREGLSILIRDDSVIMSGEDISLSGKGLNMAREVRKKHHVMESFLVNVLGMDHMSAHREACKMEHTMSQESMQKLCSVVGNNVDKDCSACHNPCNTAIHIDTSVLLSELPLHRKGRIAFLRSVNPEDVRKLISMGFVPGRELSLESKISENGPRIVTLGESTVALDADYVKAIYVNVGE